MAGSGTEPTPERPTEHACEWRFVAEVDDMESELSHAKLNPKGKLNVNLPAVVARTTVIPALPEGGGGNATLNLTAESDCGRAAQTVGRELIGRGVAVSRVAGLERCSTCCSQ
jgi:hypothetical protein